MDKLSRASIVVAKTLLLLFVLVMVAIFLMQPPLTSSTGRAQEERVFENAIPKGVPIKIKIKTEKERAFRDFRNERWLSEFELELTNTGEKPIYFLYITMVTDVKHDDQRLVFPLVYGRAELGDIVSKAGPDDVPIKPGETFVLKMGEVPGWEKGVRENRWPQATKFRAELQSMSFGDGTGYFANQSYPPADKRQSVLNDHVSFFLTKAPLTPSILPAQAERVFENQMPKDIPLKVKIKNEESFKDLKNDKWVREFEVELTNTGDKPIYFLFVTLTTNVAPGLEVIQDLNSDGLLGFSIVYGRVELGDLISKPWPDDVPIKPGESYTFTPHSGEVRYWETGIRNGSHPQPTKVRMLFQSLSFGDGTGLFGLGGQPFPEHKQ